MPTAPVLLTALLAGAVLTAGEAAPAAPAVAPKTSPLWTKITLSTEFHCEGADVADIDGDGKLDVVSGPNWYKGPTFAEATAIYPPKGVDPLGYSQHFFTFCHDVDGDAKPDVIVVGFPGAAAHWYRNPGAGGGAWTKTLVHKEISNESPQLLDCDGDGRPDLLCISDGGAFGWLSSDPTDAAKPWAWKGASALKQGQKFTHGLGFGDIDGDGLGDILEARGWWRNAGKDAAANSWQLQKAPFGKGGAQMFAYDVDGDGDNDVVTSISAHGYGLSWFEQRREGASISWKEHVILPAKAGEGGFSQLHAVDLRDMDGDGLKDIVTGKRRWAHGPKGDPDPMGAPVLYWFRLQRTKDGATWTPEEIDNDSGVGTQVVARDIDGDGLGDIVVGNKKGTFVFLQKKP